ncbi:MAG: hypothetical protein M3Q08_12635 [Pseudomonadota bacterium]|nr:hypothetical protein [Pseudomonadota bacterium]
MSSRELLSVGLIGLALFMAASPWLLGFSGNEWAASSACGIPALMMIAAMTADWRSQDPPEIRV